MILAMNVGNSNVVLGVYRGGELATYWRLTSNMGRTSDELGMVVLDFFARSGLDKNDVADIVISSVVPNMMYPLEHMCRKYFGITPMVLGVGVKTGVNIKVDNPREVGSDQIASAAGAIAHYGCPVIIADFGTATTICAVNGKREYIGCSIAPGVKISMEALFQRTAQLPRVELAAPERIIGRNTVESMQSGIVYGIVGQASYLIERMKEEMGESGIRVIATGGLSRLIAPHVPAIDTVDNLLTLKGLKAIYDRNQREEKRKDS